MEGGVRDRVRSRASRTHVVYRWAEDREEGEHFGSGDPSSSSSLGRVFGDRSSRELPTVRPRVSTVNKEYCSNHGPIEAKLICSKYGHIEDKLSAFGRRGIDPPTYLVGREGTDQPRTSRVVGVVAWPWDRGDRFVLGPR